MVDGLELAAGEKIVGLGMGGGTVVVLATDRRVVVRGGRKPFDWRHFEGLNSCGWPMQDGAHFGDEWRGGGKWDPQSSDPVTV